MPTSSFIAKTTSKFKNSPNHRTLHKSVHFNTNFKFSFNVMIAKTETSQTKKRSNPVCMFDFVAYAIFSAKRTSGRTAACNAIALTDAATHWLTDTSPSSSVVAMTTMSTPPPHKNSHHRTAVCMKMKMFTSITVKIWHSFEGQREATWRFKYKQLKLKCHCDSQSHRGLLGCCALVRLNYWWRIIFDPSVAKELLNIFCLLNWTILYDYGNVTYCTVLCFHETFVSINNLI